MLKRPNTLQNEKNKVATQFKEQAYWPKMKKKSLYYILNDKIQGFIHLVVCCRSMYTHTYENMKSDQKKEEKTNLLDWAPLKLVSMTIKEKITPEKPIAHSSMTFCNR